MKLVITSVAELDLEEIEAFIALDSPIAAVRFLEWLGNRLELIAESPGIGRRREEYAPGIRSITEGNYVIIYRVRSAAVEVLRVLHRARDPDRVIRQNPIE